MAIIASNVIEYYGFEFSSKLGFDPTLSKTEKRFKTILLVTNVIFLIFGIVLIAVGVVALSSQAGQLAGSTLPQGLIVLGAFIIAMSLLGVYAGWRESRLLLGIYFILLVLFAIILFAVGIAVYVEKDQSSSLISSGWESSSVAVQYDLQALFDCCGLRFCHDSLIYTAQTPHADGSYDYPQTSCLLSNGTCPKPPCLTTIDNAFQSSYMSAGATGIAFGVLMLVYSATICYLMIGIRKKKDLLSVRDHHRKLREVKEDPGLTQANLQLDRNIYDEQGNPIQLDEEMGGVAENNNNNTGNTNEETTNHHHENLQENQYQRNPQDYGFDADEETSEKHGATHFEDDEHQQLH